MKKDELITGARPYCVECNERGRDQPVTRKLGAWWCPIHHDRCHIETERVVDPLQELDDLIARMGEQGASEVELLVVKVARHASDGDRVLHELLELAVDALARRCAALAERTAALEAQVAALQEHVLDREEVRSE